MGRKRTCPNCQRLEREFQKYKEELSRLQAQIPVLLAENRQLKARIRELEERLGQDSSNSSQPPSADPPWKKRPPKPGSPRPRGAQPGHPDQRRRFSPPDEVDEHIVCAPKTCARCGGALPLEEEPHAHYEEKVELPPIKPMVRGYWLLTRRCGKCGYENRASLPDGVSKGVFGPQIQALVSLLSGGYRLSKREIVRLMKEVFQVKLSLGSVANLENATSLALEHPVAQAQKSAQKQKVVYADETGWREDKKKAWLWTHVTPQVVTFLIRRSRGSDAARDLIGEDYTGILHSDRWQGYNWFPLRNRQLCWAHLKRNFKKVEERGGASAKIGKGLAEWTAKMFSLWDRFREGSLKRTTLRTYMTKVKAEIHGLLEKGEKSRNEKTSRFCKNILALKPALWTFLRKEGVEPTNNVAERAIRKPVLWRKGSFGTDSAKGSRFVERILTTVATLRVQERDPLDYLVQTCGAFQAGKSGPSLLHE